MQLCRQQQESKEQQEELEERIEDYLLKIRRLQEEVLASQKEISFVAENLKQKCQQIKQYDITHHEQVSKLKLEIESLSSSLDRALNSESRYKHLYE